MKNGRESGEDRWDDISSIALKSGRAEGEISLFSSLMKQHLIDNYTDPVDSSSMQR
jgi:hypothetical protein